MTEEKRNILVLGVGGGAMLALNYILENITDSIKADFLCIDTDKESLNESKTKIMQIGKKLTKNMGAFSNPQIGIYAVVENWKKIAKVFKKYKTIIVIACVGGGTGGGSGIALTKLAKDLGLRAICLVTKPFEAKTRVLPMTNMVIQKLNYYSDALSIVDVEMQLRLAQFEIINKKILERFMDIYEKELNKTEDNIVKEAENEG